MEVLFWSGCQQVLMRVSALHLPICIRKTEYEKEERFWGELSQYQKGSRRLGAKEKQQLGLKLTEGKKVLSFRGYRRLAMKLFESGRKEHISAHLFLVLDWNLIARAVCWSPDEPH